MSRLKPVLIALTFLALAALSCNLPLGNRGGREVSGRTMTAIIKTVKVGLTGTAQVLSAVPGFPGATLTFTATRRADRSQTPTPPFLSSPLSRCNWGLFVSDVTVPDGTRFPPGAAFTKTWRLKNIGTCTWTTEYTVSFESGNVMGGPASVPMPKVVQPGEEVDISVNLTAPNTPGPQKGNWKLRNPAGIAFGVGGDALDPFYVQIVVSAATP